MLVRILIDKRHDEISLERLHEVTVEIPDDPEGRRNGEIATAYDRNGEHIEIRVDFP